MVTGALKTGQEIAHVPPTLFPEDPNPRNYVDAWIGVEIGRLLLNTIWYAFGALAFQLVLGVAAAYAFSKLRPIFGNVVLGAMLATLMIPATVLVIPQYVTVIDMPIFGWNLLNTPWAIWLPAVTNAFNIFLLKRFFDSIPNDMLQAAAIDGAGPLRVLWSIILPVSRPILGVVSIFSVTATFKDFLWPLAGPALAIDEDGQRRHLCILDRPRPERRHRCCRHRGDPDDHLLPDLPEEHHVRPHGGQHQGLIHQARSRPAYPAPH